MITDPTESSMTTHMGQKIQETKSTHQEKEWRLDGGCKNKHQTPETQGGKKKVEEIQPEDQAMTTRNLLQEL